MTRTRLLPSVAAVALLVASCTSNPAPGRAVRPSSPRPPIPRGWVSHVDGGDRLSIATPKTWTFRGRNVSGPISPAVDFGVGTWAFPRGGACAPSRAAAVVPKGGAFFFIFDYPGDFRRSQFPPRPRHFRLGKEGGPAECLGVKDYVVLFRERGRLFQVQIVLGHNATQRVRTQVVQALDTLRVL